jgi:SSS family solute:Na+ symporter
MTFMTIAVILYFGAVAYLGYRGFRQTHTATDYMLGGRKIHPFVMAMSYGATFISTSAIVGFGGAAGVFGMGLLWLTFLNIFVGIFIAFVFFGGRTRRIGLRLDAHTFPELLGRRFQSRFIQMAVGSLIFLFMPLYASAVLMGAAKYLAQQLNMPYEAALFTFSVIIALYVVMGGMKGVMYTDAFQGSLMFVGMAALLVLTYVRMGGITEAHAQLTALAPMVPAKLAAGGHLGWTAMPVFGSPLWWTLVSTIVLGVGIGVLGTGPGRGHRRRVHSHDDGRCICSRGALECLFPGNDRESSDSSRRRRCGTNHSVVSARGDAGLVRDPVHADAPVGGHEHAQQSIPHDGYITGAGCLRAVAA